MKQIFFILAACLTGINAYSFTSEIKTVKLNDGEEIKGRLCLPDNEVKTIVFCIHGTGPGTWLTKRPTFNFYDELAKGFCEQGLAFFTYNRRGCEIGDTPPLFVDVDSVKYAKYTPLQEAEDVEKMIFSLMEDPRFKNSKIILYGMSEGTVIAPIVAERSNVRIDALLLHGYAHDNMFDIIKWQTEGHGLMIAADAIFDENSDRRISKEEYEDSSGKKEAQRGYFFQNIPFDSLDVVKDGFLDIEDIRKMRMPFHHYLMKCITEDNYRWIKNNYFNVTPRWCKSHFELEANKTRLMRINIPIHVFHGTDDASVPVENVYDLQSRFNVCNKTNLFIYVFEKHNHDLNFLDWLSNKQWSEGLKTIFRVAKSI
jgi:pimeloyl-ACP methyl ester carboxylesterase